MGTSIKIRRLSGAIILMTASALAQASLIVAPHGAGRDSDLAGVVVASPDDGQSSLLVNPAGVVSKARNEAEFAIYPGAFKVSYQNPMTGYDAHGRTDFVALGFWYGLGEIRGWSVGVGAYGSLGAAFNLPPAPGIGQTSPYLGEMGIMNFGINAGKQLTPDLRLGLQLAPHIGTQKMRMPTPLGDSHLKAKGFGLSASAGIVYTLTDKVSLGLAYRTPGIAKFSGEARVGAVEQDDSVKFVSPQSITAGLAYQYNEKLKLLSQVAWTRYKDFERGTIEFHETTALNSAMLSSATNRARWGVAMEYQFLPRHVFRAGFTSSKAMIPDSAVSPMMYDHDNDMIMAGYETDFETWRLGFTTGYAKNVGRNVSVADNPMFPGRYRSKSPVSVGVRVAWLTGHK